MSSNPKANDSKRAHDGERLALNVGQRRWLNTRRSDVRRPAPTRTFFAAPEEWEVDDDLDCDNGPSSGFFTSDLLDAEFDRWETAYTAATDFGSRMIAAHVEPDIEDEPLFRP